MDRRFNDWLDILPAKCTLYVVNHTIETFDNIDKECVMKIQLFPDEDFHEALGYGFTVYHRENPLMLIIAVQEDTKSLQDAYFYDYTPVRFYKNGKVKELELIQELLAENLKPELSEGIFFGNTNIIQEIHQSLEQRNHRDIMNTISNIISNINRLDMSAKQQILLCLIGILNLNNNKVHRLVQKSFTPDFIQVFKLKIGELMNTGIGYYAMECDPDLAASVQLWQNYT